MIEVSVPGKLFIAGEYAVVEAGYPAVVIAVDQFITVSLSKTEKVGSIQSSQYGDLPIKWVRRNGELVLDKRENPFHYILAAIRITENYAKEIGRELGFFDLVISSELDNSKGRKYGLGSSGAVTVATVRALAQFYELEATDEIIYKLSALAHLAVQGNGSTGDIAASVYTGWIAFSTFDKEWVEKRLETESLGELIHQPWPKLRIERLPVPKKLRLLIGWTGTPASTANLVDKVQQASETEKDYYQQFLDESKKIVEKLITGFKEKNITIIQQQITENRKLLKQLGKHFGVNIETKKLERMIELAKAHHGAAKSSGAGGGDCGVVFFKEKDGIIPLVNDWEKEGITPLPLHVYEKGENV
ncbi:MAG: phosphomevalonate kinase [Lactobacillales bacterium]|nr:phosphomevalonate kinase [Lactobacillales bacterium]